MNGAEIAEAVAAVWFTVFFGLCMLVPLFRAPCKAAKRRAARRQDDDS